MSSVEVALFAVIPFHALFDAELEVAFDKRRHLCNGLFEYGAVFGRELRQDPVAKVKFRGALAHAKTDSRELVAHVLDDVAEPVLAAVTTVLAATDTAYIQINVIAENEQMIDLHLIPGHECLHGLARQVHISLRFNKQAFFTRDVHLHGKRLVFAFPVLAWIGQLFDRHKARIMMCI